MIINRFLSLELCSGVAKGVRGVRMAPGDTLLGGDTLTFKAKTGHELAGGDTQKLPHRVTPNLATPLFL